MERRVKLQLMRDVLEHLGDCFDQWQSTDSSSEHYLAAAIDRDLNEFRRLCESLRQGSGCAVS